MRCLTFKQYESFEKEKKKDYFINTNKTFQNWLKNDFRKNAYDINIEEVSNLIQFLKNWCIFKYPENELNKPGIVIPFFEDIKNLEDELNIKQMLYRMDSDNIFLIEGGYSTGSAALTQIPIECNDDDFIYSSKDKFVYSLKIKEINKDDFYSFDDYIEFTSEGYINIRKANELFNTLGESTHSKPLHIKTLYDILLKHKDKYDLSEIKKCIIRHDFLYELRNYIMEFTAYELIYNETTNFYNGYLRTEKMVKEMKEYYPDFDFDLTKFKKIVDKEY